MKFNSITFPGNKLARVLYKIIGRKKRLGISNEKEVKHSGSNKIDFIADVKLLNESQFITHLFADLNKYEYYVSVYLHGSYADNTATYFSDIDDFVIINDKNTQKDQIEKIVYALNKIDMKFCRLDPLQHHGHWIVSKSELNNYDNSFIPIFILKNARIILGDRCVSAKINLDTTYEGLRENITRTADNIEELSYEMFDLSINAYKLKRLIGSIALIPAMIFQFNGNNIDKKEAISRSSEIFSPENNILTLWATDCRNNWSTIINTFQFKMFSLLPHFVNNPYLWRKIANKCSPKIKRYQLEILSNRLYNEEILQRYLREVRSYVK